ncbi:SurA N-terminal domain-containing protein [uncultured Cohaesibacter sp.]|uniref:SurA N-terminal domain-containing protein n=1 Tax=uncultured Cohaesibacter sp. TaxID=1002546 RepID=UPI0029C982D4|nr:SurA N-terminal domain-containing protein [uncultured Cohaesibacter sp.]
MFNHMTRTTSFLLMLPITLMLTATMVVPSSASRIVAVVNNAVITELDVTQRQKLETILSGGKVRIGKGSALNSLIDDKLKLFEARTRKMTASDKEVTEALDNMAKNARINRTRLVGFFRQGGVSEESLKEWLKTQLSWRSLIRARYNAQIRVDEAEIVNALSERKESEDKVENATEYEITSVIFVTRAKAGSGGTEPSPL